MAQPFKKQTVRYSTPDGQRCGPDTLGAIKRVEESRKYYGLVPQPDSRRKPSPSAPTWGGPSSYSTSCWPTPRCASTVWPTTTPNTANGRWPTTWLTSAPPWPSRATIPDTSG